MNLRARSRSGQWLRWTAVACVALFAHAVLSFAFFGNVSLNVFEPRVHRLALPVVLLAMCLGWEMRWDGVVRKVGRRERTDDGIERRRMADGAVEVGADGRGEGRERERNLPTPSVARVPHAHGESVKAAGCVRGGAVTPEDFSGEELYARARTIPHLPIPDFRHDGAYLGLLGKSAARGCAPALAKLGDYAMRRAAWVEAYYWFWQARRKGVPDLDAVLLSIRRSWVSAGFPDEATNVHPLFPEELGSIGRALLHIDVGRQSAAAREFLRAHHPEFAC